MLNSGSPWSDFMSLNLFRRYWSFLLLLDVLTMPSEEVLAEGLGDQSCDGKGVAVDGGNGGGSAGGEIVGEVLVVKGVYCVLIRLDS